MWGAVKAPTIEIDRQHPHDLFMELATTYSYDLSTNSSVYVYAGLPDGLKPFYGDPTSAMAFVRLKIE